MIVPVKPDEEALKEFLKETSGIYFVFRAIGEDVKEAYICDTQQEVQALRERMGEFGGEFSLLAKPN